MKPTHENDQRDDCGDNAETYESYGHKHDGSGSEDVDYDSKPLGVGLRFCREVGVWGVKFVYRKILLRSHIICRQLKLRFVTCNGSGGGGNTVPLPSRFPFVNAGAEL